MDSRFQTSFIPKKPIVATPGRASAPISLFSLLATVIFVVAVALSGLSFFYKQLMVRQIASGKESLERAKEAFEPQLIKEMIRVDNRLETSKKLLDSHIAVTPFFDFLSSITLETVRFKDFNFSYLAKDKIQLIMKGQALSYAAVALQSDLLNAQKYLHGTIVGEMALDTSGIVTFNVSTIIDPSILSYKEALARGTAEVPEPPADEIELNESVGTSTGTTTSQ